MPWNWRASNFWQNERLTVVLTRFSGLLVATTRENLVRSMDFLPNPKPNPVHTKTAQLATFWGCLRSSESELWLTSEALDTSLHPKSSSYEGRDSLVRCFGGEGKSVSCTPKLEALILNLNPLSPTSTLILPLYIPSRPTWNAQKSGKDPESSFSPCLIHTPYTQNPQPQTLLPKLLSPPPQSLILTCLPRIQLATQTLDPIDPRR